MQVLKLHMLLACVAVAVDSMAVSILETAVDGETTAVDGEATNLAQPNKTKKKSESVEERAFNRQLKQLKKMKCKPYLTKVYVADEIGEADEKKDKSLYPQVVAVKRCNANCSYCGDNSGRETKKCLTARHKDKNFTIRYYDDTQHRHYFKVPIRVDTTCHCVQ